MPDNGMFTGPAPSGGHFSRPHFLRRSFLVRTLKRTIGRFAVEAKRALLRRRRRSRRAVAEKKCRTTHPITIAARTPRVMRIAGPPKFMELYLTHAPGM